MLKFSNAGFSWVWPLWIYHWERARIHIWWWSLQPARWGKSNYDIKTVNNGEICCRSPWFWWTDMCHSYKDSSAAINSAMPSDCLWKLSHTLPHWYGNNSVISLTLKIYLFPALCVGSSVLCWSWWLRSAWPWSGGAVLHRSSTNTPPLWPDQHWLYCCRNRTQQWVKSTSSAVFKLNSISTCVIWFTF